MQGHFLVSFAGMNFFNKTGHGVSRLHWYVQPARGQLKVIPNDVITLKHVQIDFLGVLCRELSLADLTLTATTELE